MAFQPDPGDHRRGERRTFMHLAIWWGPSSWGPIMGRICYFSPWENHRKHDFLHDKTIEKIRKHDLTWHVENGELNMTSPYLTWGVPKGTQQLSDGEVDVQLKGCLKSRNPKSFGKHRRFTMIIRDNYPYQTPMKKCGPCGPPGHKLVYRPHEYHT